MLSVGVPVVWRTNRLLPPPVACTVRLPVTVGRAPAWFQSPPSDATLRVRFPQDVLGSATGVVPPFAHLSNSTVLEAPKVRVVEPGTSEAAPLLDELAALWM